MQQTRSPSDQADKFLLRLPDGMRSRIAGEAKRNGRSSTAEIVVRLAASLDGEPPSSNSVNTVSSPHLVDGATEIRAIGDLTDQFRTLAAYVMLPVLKHLPKGALDPAVQSFMQGDAARWLAQHDARGAVHSIVRLIETADSGTLDKLKTFAAYLDKQDDGGL